MIISEYLRSNFSEPIPQWLAQASPGMSFPRKEFFGGRTVYYPGAGDDGHAVKAFGSSHVAHCFIYVDFDYDRHQLFQRLDSQQFGFKGYRSVVRCDVTRQDLLPRQWHPQIHIGLNYPEFAMQAIRNPFAVFEVLERTADFDDDHGPERLAILFIAGCGYATFHALYSQNRSFVPYGLLLQDHGFSGNPDRFGAGGLLEKLAKNDNKLPTFLLVGDNTDGWEGYRRIDGLESEPGGMHAQPRSLYFRAGS